MSFQILWYKYIFLNVLYFYLYEYIMISLISNKNRINNVTLMISDTCFFRCIMCNFWKNTKKDNILPVSIYDKFFKELKNIKSKDLVVSFLGGEPLAVPKLFELIKLAKLSNLVTNVHTNGWLLTNNVIKQLYESGLDKISISLDGSTAKIHDSIRGMKGSYKRIIDGIKNMYQYYKKNGKNLKIIISTVILSRNIDDILNLVDLVEKIPYIESIRFQAVAGQCLGQGNEPSYDVDNKNISYWFEEGEYNNLWPKEKEKLIELYTQLIFLKSEPSKISNSVERLKMQYHYFMHPELRLSNITCITYRELSVLTNGDVLHCCPNKEVIGNIYSTSLSDMLNSQKGKLLAIKVINCKCNCHQLINCGFPQDNKSFL